MPSRTLYFGSAGYLKLKDDQLVLSVQKDPLGLSDSDSQKSQEDVSIPIEDIGVVVLDHPQLVYTHALVGRLLEENVGVIVCDSTHHPAGLLLPLSGNTLQQERFQQQIEATEPLRKRLWQQTIQQKILNQAGLLKQKGLPVKNMIYWSESVRSGDPDNYEGRAAAHYWKHLFAGYVAGFKRDRYGEPPNNVLNYGYAILRAMVARGLVATGLLPTFGIHHQNRYNAFCLADDVMEPYRPFLDGIVLDMMIDGVDVSELNRSVKADLLKIGAIDVIIGERRSPLQEAINKTCQTVGQCVAGKSRKISYPSWPG